MLTRRTAARRAFVGFAAVALITRGQPAGAGSEFTYQGQLEFGGQPVNATCSFEFSLWNAASGGLQQGSTLNRGNVTVTNGLFTVQLDFGGSALGSGSRWLQTEVGCVGLSGLVTLSRQPLTAAPYAYSADTVVAGGVGSTQLADDAVTSAKIASGAVTATEIGSNAVTSAKIAGGAVGSSELASGAVTSAKIATDAVGSAEIASGAVGTAAMASGAVTSAKIQDGTITASDVDTSSLQRRVTGNCAANTAMTSIDQSGGVTCTPLAGDITEVIAGNGLTGGGTSGAVSLAVDYASDGSSTSVPRADHTHRGQVWVPFFFPADVGLTVENTTGVALKGTNLGGTGVEGVSTTGSGVEATSTNGIGVEAVSTTGHGVKGTSSSANGVYGISSATALLNAGVLGENFGTNGTGVKGIGYSGTSAFGVFGDSPDGRGVYGNSSNGYGVYGSTGAEKPEGETFAKAGVTGESSAYTGTGVRGIADGTYANAVVGSAGGYGGYGVRGSASAAQGVGVYAEALGDTGYGVIGLGNATGVMGTSDLASATTDGGVVGKSFGNNGIGVRGVANTGTNAWAINGESTDGYAGYFQGKVQVTGALTAGVKPFKIDHPLDPANKYLYHAAVESSDMKNVYDGVVTLDEEGEAVVTLPDWLEALNRDFRYQLTCIGGFAPVYVAEKIHGNRFRIAGGTAGLEVSWLVTGVRQDAFANAHPIIVEEEKPADEKGLYLHPVELGQPESLSVSKSKEAAK